MCAIDTDRKNMADCFLPDIKSTRTCTEAIDKYLRKFVISKDYRSACRYSRNPGDAAAAVTHTRHTKHNTHVLRYSAVFVTLFVTLLTRLREAVFMKLS